MVNLLHFLYKKFTNAALSSLAKMPKMILAMVKTSHHAGTKSEEIQLLHVKLGTVSRIMLDCTGESYSKKTPAFVPCKYFFSPWECANLTRNLLKIVCTNIWIELD